MNKKELLEIRKNFREDSGFFTLDRILTAYVDPEKNVLYKENKNFALIPEDKGTVMFETLRKVLGGSLGKHLVEYAFPERAYEDGSIHGSLTLALWARLRDTEGLIANNMDMFDSFVPDNSPEFVLIKARWDCNGYSWSYETDIPHECFKILDDGEPYCLGFVFDVSHLPKLPF